MSNYTTQLYAINDAIDIDFWKYPEGVSVDYDDLKFLFIPDAVEAAIVANLARSVYAYQKQHHASDDQITKAVMITMGGLLPGVLLHDHLAWQLNGGMPAIEFGTLGVKYYAGPGQPLDEPRVVKDLTVEVDGRVVGIVEDLVDLGGTAKFVSQYLLQRGAREVVLIAPYLKSTGILNEMTVIIFGFVPKDTWIITPRERVETLIKRVPHWQAQGASQDACEANLRAIGYPNYLIDLYLPMAYSS
ncbi:MAG: phosphoribosyltransferase [Chloroflexi bacterium]|nr:MAG: phosphoribosyltransferase [Chloroflexota bacterium]